MTAKQDKAYSYLIGKLNWICGALYIRGLEADIIYLSKDKFQRVFDGVGIHSINILGRDLRLVIVDEINAGKSSFAVSNYSIVNNTKFQQETLTSFLAYEYFGALRIDDYFANYSLKTKNNEDCKELPT